MPRFEEYLSKLDVFYRLKCPILIEGPVGSGKSSLIEEFHRRASSQEACAPVILNMGEQSDAKTLFGAFVTNPARPGEFCWKAGVILEALSSGRWLVIEDVDLASPEMVATVKGLLESKSDYYVAPMGKSFPIHQDFRLIATRRSDMANSAASLSTAFDRLGRDLWQSLSIPALSASELEIILFGRFPKLNPILVNVILRLFGVIESKESSEISSNALFKFCSRIVQLVNNLSLASDDFVSEDLRQSLLYEAVDCFASAWSSRDKRKELAKEMSLILSLPDVQIDALYESKPQMTLNPDRSHLSIGRVDFTAECQGMSRFRASENSSSSMALTTLCCQTLEKLAVAVKMNEPVLLVGETGTGKTTTVQHLAQMLQFQPNLRVLNMSQQSEASDLLGGFKPFSAQSLARPLLDEFLNIFGKAFSKSKNGEYLTAIQEAFVKQSWKRFIKLVKQAVELILSKTSNTTTSVSPILLERLKGSVDRFEAQVAYAENNLLFSFVEGSLVEALTEGHWLLLDEINLASPETLNILAGLLRNPSASVTLTERGDSNPIPRHPNFRLFACMNPATDVSKRDLPPAIRSRFTQIYVDETDVRRDDLRQVIDHLIGPGRDGTLKERLTALYYRLKDLVQSFELVDGNGRKPLLNLRTLTRPIKFARLCENIYGLERALYEGWCLSFTTMLDESSARATRSILREFLMPAAASVVPLRPFTSAIPIYTAGKAHILIEGYVLLTGPLFDHLNPEAQEHSFVLTPSVQRNVAMLARAVMARNYPILLEGPTSAGKTSVIEYLAKRTGHHFVRINNHEHTDIQEYLGTYVSDPDNGRLVFKEGILVQALRKGHWLVLDELNLAPSDILEALNRLLDDNRELFLPETGETVRPHPDFQLFATQNPAGAVYGGRKALSRAFRSRFLELQFNDLPLDEIEQILSSRCKIAPSFARRIAQVYRILQERRSTAGTNIFAGKHALITLRDCFRWAERHSHSAVGSTQELAQDGYFVLAERCRHPEEAQFIRATLEKVCKTQLDSDFEMYSLTRLCQQRGWLEDLPRLELVEQLARDLKITWTKPIRRLFTLVYLCIRFREPVILVGETGCGKTTVCQLVAQILQRALRIVNCHANSESGDFLGSFRPVRSEESTESTAKLFQWTDGPLVEAMKQGDLFLMDEISLADDSVLERLNSVLEPSRYLLLAECTENDEARVISASPNFAILATMNPGGDFGKKELSPALRNRFTEIWVPTIGDRDDLQLIIATGLAGESAPVLQVMTEFWYWWQEALLSSSSGASILSASKRTASSLRDLLGWIQFANSPSVIRNVPKIELRLLHGAAMIFTDRLGNENSALRLGTLNHLADALNLSKEERLQVIEIEFSSRIHCDSASFSIGPFALPVTAQIADSEAFAFDAPTTRVSALRVLRALQLGKAVLLEGSPGVGKTTLIGALAGITGHKLTRINLSEQTDLVDLFGSDLPVDGGVAGRFRWADGPFLQALKRGDWILLDELNLASQSVLEGLNACLDHRGTVFIPELGREFECSPGTRIFAAQNPAAQGGGRKGLPKSFLNRFTVVWFDSLVSSDYHVILSSNLKPNDPLSSDDITRMIRFNEALNQQIYDKFSSNGRPWEFNLRDLSRWIRLIQSSSSHGTFTSPVQFIRALYASRFRCEEDHQAVGEIVESIFGVEETRHHFRQLPLYDVVQGDFKFLGKSFKLPSSGNERLLFLREQFVPLEAALMALEMGWLCILTGSGSSGKSALIDSLAHLHQINLRRFFVSPDTDTLELLGSFEQVDYQRRWNLLQEEIQKYSEPFDCPNYTTLSADTMESILRPCPEQLKQRVLRFLSDSKAQSSEGRFEWVDGPLVRAMTLGHWLVLENVNLASSAVLDRLNSLFEPNGALVLSEQGSTSSEGVRIIRPTHGFRLFMTVDPKFGEISRAMRNRGIEIACYPRDQSRVLDDLQILRQSFGSQNDPRIVPLLRKLLPLKVSRRVLHRISQSAALLPNATVNELLSILNIQSTESEVALSVEDEFWLEKLPFIISNSVENVPLALQRSMLPTEQTSLSTDLVALISLFLLNWPNETDLSSRLQEVSSIFPLEKPVSSKLSLLIEMIKSSFSLSPNDLQLLENFTNEKLFGYLLWILTNDQSLSSHTQILESTGSADSSRPSPSLEDWMEKWRHFGFKNELCPQIYLSLRQYFNSPAVLNSSDALQVEILDAFEIIFSTTQQNELLPQIEKFSTLLTVCLPGSKPLKINTFLSVPLTLIFLNKIGQSVLRRFQKPSIPSAVTISRASLAQEWFSQIWSLSDEPLNFFSGFDGLGSLLETANRTWNARCTLDELELMKVFDDVLKFVVRHGGKDKRQERLHLLKGLTFSDSCDPAKLASDLIESSLKFFSSPLNRIFDPVSGHFQIIQRSLSTSADFYNSEVKWQKIFNCAYFGSNFLLQDNCVEIAALTTEIDEVKEFILLRDPSQLEDLMNCVSVRLNPLIAQVKDFLNALKPTKIQLETLQSSLLRLRSDFISPRFVLLRDLTAPFVDAIDRLKVGLYLKQIEEERTNNCNILPLNFVQMNLTWNFPDNFPHDALVADTVALNLSRYIPHTESELLGERVIPLLARTLESVHEAIKLEATRNQKDDSLFVFKGSNNDDDAMDSQLASELFGDYEKRSELRTEHSFDDDEATYMEIDHFDPATFVPVQKRVDYSALSADLLSICQGVASDSKNLLQVSDILSRSFEFIGKSLNLTEFSDSQVYRMLIWTLSEKLNKRRASPEDLKRKKKQAVHYDFYREACPEGRLQDAIKVMQEFQARLIELLADWPEHDVLQALERQIDRFFKLPVASTSMIEALLSLEKLYLRSQDWEKYAASKETSLGQSVPDLLHLIVEWRRAEVENWRGLIDSVVMKMENDSIIKNGEWLSIARVALSQINKESIPSIIELIDTFVLSAPIGQFSKRIEILEFCSKLSNLQIPHESDNYTAKAFNSSLLYYQTTLAHRVKEYIRVCREPVERDLSAFLMTLYWKDINYWSVRQTAEKSHRHLAKMIRRWKESMQMPLSALLSQLTIKPQLQASSLDQPEKKKRPLPIAPIKSIVCTSIGIKVKNRLDSLNFSALDAGIVDSFGETILDTLNELKESTDSSIQSKQKAFVDLIRELKVLGIRINKIPSDDWLTAKSILSAFAEATKLNIPRDAKSEYYLIRTLEKWQKLATSVAHEDITFRQAEIIKNSMAYLIEMLICGKSRESRDTLAKDSHRLRSLLECIDYRQGIQGSNPNYFNVEVFESFAAMLWKCQVQLSQLTAMFESHRAQGVGPGLNWSLLSELFSLSKSSFTEISSLLQSVHRFEMTPVPLAKSLIDRISLLISSLLQSLKECDSSDSLVSVQISDLLGALKSILTSISLSWQGLISNSICQVGELSSLEADPLMRKVLLSVQLCETEIPLPSTEALDEFSFYPDYLRKQAESSGKIISLVLTAIYPAIEAVLGHSACPIELVEISKLTANKLLNWIDALVVDHYRALSRLTLILSNVFLHLYQEGFCRPPPVDETAKTEDSKDGKLTEGTGIGEGEGEKNVSKEIEFEEQVTGTLDEKEEEPKEKEKKDKEDKGEDGDKDELDMNQDFDGALEDLMNEDEEEDEEAKKDEEDERPQDQMNDEEEDANQDNSGENEEIQDLDPSWWNSENEDDEEVDAPENSENQKLPDNQSKEKQKNQKQPKDEKEQEAIAGQENDSTDETEETESIGDKEEKKEMDAEDQDVDVNDADMDETSDVDTPEIDTEGIESDAEVEDQKAPEDVEMGDAEDVKPETVDPETIESGETEEPEPENQESESMEIDTPELEAEADKPEESEENPEDNAENASASKQENQMGHDEMQQQDFEKNGEAISSQQSQQSEEQPQTGDEQQVKTFDTTGQSGNSEELDDQSTQNEVQPIAEQVEKWKRTIHRILNNKSEDSKPESPEKPNLDNLTKEQQYEAAEKDDEKAMAVKAEAEEAIQIQGEDDTSTSKDQASLNASEPTETDDSKESEDLQEPESGEADLKLVPHLKKSEESIPILNTQDKELEEHLRQLSLLPTWSEFEQSTSDLAFDLCEQLRLVLAPTQATKLRGDYRTGKRLNLRKILPYIASQYRRDKIWLRRTKPSQRNYRVCLSIDNSKSMMETGSVGLAYEAIATISQALERLEVGELALVGFGEHSRVLQEFSSGVAKVSVGEQLRSNLLRFDEASTDVPALLETVLDTFTSAQASTNASCPIWQLNVILSDGICHQHDKIKPLLARCHSARILNIFVLLDNRPIESSIFELSHVEYVDQGVDSITGQVKTAIKMTKYLETFPFEFYVVLRDVKMLPNILAESLKQWFELISLQEGEH